MTTRIALGVRYRGAAYLGWQTQPNGRSVQDALERALSTFADRPVRTTCAGRTDAGVHALNQVVHLDPGVEREPFGWVRGTNRYLPDDIAVQWCRAVEPDFHARFSARSRRYRYLLLQSPVRPSLEAGLVGWVIRPLDGDAMRLAAARLIGEHDFSAFRSSECQAASPVRQLRQVRITQRGPRWAFDFHANAFLHHMVRNLMGTLLAVGSGRRDADWVAEVLVGRDRSAAAPTFAPQGLYFVGAQYDDRHAIPSALHEVDALTTPE